MVTYPGCTIDGSWLPAAKQRELLQQKAQREHSWKNSYIEGAKDKFLKKKKLKIVTFTFGNIGAGGQNSLHSGKPLQQHNTLAFFVTKFLRKEFKRKETKLTQKA